MAPAQPGTQGAEAPLGYRIMPRTADIGVEAWGPSREACIAEAVHGVVQAFTDTATVHPARTRRCWFPDNGDQDLLVNVLDEAVHVLDTEHEAPVDVELEPRDKGVAVRFAMVDASVPDRAGAVPKGVSLHGLRIGRVAGGWSCAAIVNV